MNNILSVSPIHTDHSGSASVTVHGVDVKTLKYQSVPEYEN